MTQALESLKNLHFNWFLLCKVFNISSSKIQRRYLSWHWRVMQNFKKNWLVVWKMTWGIWQIFTRALESLKLGTLMGSFNPIYRGVMSHDNEEWCKIWRGVHLPFQNWHGQFEEFLPEHLKVSQIFTLMCYFWAKHIFLELKK